VQFRHPTAEQNQKNKEQYDVIQSNSGGFAANADEIDLGKEEKKNGPKRTPRQKHTGLLTLLVETVKKEYRPGRCYVGSLLAGECWQGGDSS